MTHKPLVFITGASSGIGQALAARYHRAGYRLALCARRGPQMQEWAQSLGPWDGTPRVDKFLHTYFGAEDNDYSTAVSRYLWTALAGRALKPGIKADMVPILYGQQGTIKSSAIAALVPWEE